MTLNGANWFEDIHGVLHIKWRNAARQYVPPFLIDCYFIHIQFVSLIY